MRGMSNPTLDLIQKMFRKYYMESFQEISLPNSFEKREFGALLFKEKIMIRHKKFDAPAELKSFLCSVIPSDVYYSGAYYEQPDASEMDAKDWIGADLIFDIDADHILTGCEKTHDKWSCLKCGFAGRGVTPPTCPVCEGEKFNEKTWLCNACLESAKHETKKLLDILQDFGFSEKDIHVYFSGHRGYHVHVEDESVRSLDAVARKEIVDYFSGIGLDLRFHGLGNDGFNVSYISRGYSGWNMRIVRGVFEFLSGTTPQDLEGIGLRKNVVNAIVKNKDTLVESWRGSGSWSAVKGVGFETWKKILKKAVDMQSVNLDTVVTTDVHRLIRVTGTLHGKTGLKKVEFPVSRMEEFDPLKEAIAFKSGALTIHISDVPKFSLGGEEFGPYQEKTVSLPTAAALFLLCKNVARLVE